VPAPNVTRWVKSATKLRQDAASITRQKTLGCKAARASRVLRFRQAIGPEWKQLDKRLHLKCIERARQRRSLPVPVVRRLARTTLEELKDIGVELKPKGRVLECSTSWCWRWLYRMGWHSRMSVCKRPTPLPVARAALLT
jgi:hypothetical protein